jgi:hypothetical protein
MTAWTVDWAEHDGLILNGIDDFGVKWGMYADEFDGWGSTAPTLEVAQRTRASGGWSGDSFGRPRTVAIGGWVKAPTPALLVEAKRRLIAAVSRDERMLRVSEAGVIRWVMAKRSDEVIFDRIRPNYARWSIQVTADDWRKFGTELIGSTELPATEGGLTIPFTIPFSIDSTVVAGTVTLINDGNEIGPVRIRVDGPVVGPVITHVGSGRALVFSSSQELLAGEWLDIDMEAHTVLANGQASRSAWIESRGWSAFEPGSNQWAFTAAEFSPDTLATIYATPADE